MSRRSFFFFFNKLVDELRVNPDSMDGQKKKKKNIADSKMSGYGWTGPERFNDIDSQV